MDADPANATPHVVQLAAVTWDFQLIGRTRMLAEAWRRAGRASSFIEPPHSYRSRLQQLFAGPLDSGNINVLRPGPTRYPVRWWPRMHERRLRAMMRSGAHALRRRLDRLICWERSAALVVTPMWLPWLDVLPFNTVVYDCIDDLTVHAPDPAFHRIYKPWEGELIDRCDGAIATAEVLRDAIRSRRTDLPVAMIKNGVDVDRFDAAEARLPDARASKRRPIVGFVGALLENEEWIDWRGIRHVVTALSDVDFVFVGPHTEGEDIRWLQGRENVRLIGAVSHEHVPRHIADFDVCWVPFRDSESVRNANPVKNYEYLAMGKPVVSTACADTASFDGFVLAGHKAEQVTTLLRDALAAPCDDAEARIAFARRNSWDARASEIEAFLA